MNKNDIRSPEQVRDALRHCGMLLIAQRGKLANNLPHAKNHRHDCWRVVICDTYPETQQGRIDIESDRSRRRVDVCRPAHKEVLAAAVTQLGWSPEAFEDAGGLHDFNVENYGDCLSKVCPVCANQLSGKEPTATTDSSAA